MDNSPYSDDIKAVEGIEFGLPNNRGGSFISVYKLQNAILVSASLADEFTIKHGEKVSFHIVSVNGTKKIILYKVDQPLNRNYLVIRKYKGGIYKIYSKNIVSKFLEMYESGVSEDATQKIEASIISNRPLEINNILVKEYILFT